MLVCCGVLGRQCLCSGERDWIWAVSGQRALLWSGQCKWLIWSAKLYLFKTVSPNLNDTRKQLSAAFLLAHFFVFNSWDFWQLLFLGYCTLFICVFSLGTPATATRCCRPFTSAGRSGRRSWLTAVSLDGRRTCSLASLTCSTVLPTRRGKWVSYHPRSSSHGYARKMVSGEWSNLWGNHSWE